PALGTDHGCLRAALPTAGHKPGGPPAAQHRPVLDELPGPAGLPAPGACRQPPDDSGRSDGTIRPGAGLASLPATSAQHGRDGAPSRPAGPAGGNTGRRGVVVAGQPLERPGRRRPARVAMGAGPHDLVLALPLVVLGTALERM